MKLLMKIDAHQHFWSIERPNDYGFLIPASGVLYQDYLPAELQPDLEAAGINYTILVQAAETEEETKWLLNLAKDVNYIAGVTGWIDFDTPAETFRQRLQFFRRDPKFVALRPMLQDLPDARFILRPQVLANLKLLASLDFPFELLVYPKHLPYVYEMLQEVPGLRVVIDHLAKPSIGEGSIDTWLFWMEQISQFPDTWCKLSGMVTQADHQHWKGDDFVPYVQGMVSCFGPGRLMYGSDWPVCLQAASYEQVYRLLVDVLERLPVKLDQVALEAIFGKNAWKFYKLNLQVSTELKPITKNI
jgi:L-fuconolactonase